MTKLGKWIARHRVLVLLLGILLVIPSIFGYAKTRVNYDLLGYLPDSLENAGGQNIMADEYGVGALLLPAMLLVFDKVILCTAIGFREKGQGKTA